MQPEGLLPERMHLFDWWPLALGLLVVRWLHWLEALLGFEPFSHLIASVVIRVLEATTTVGIRD